jgi:UTP:GlnB (protein PII) uridylyltransferase
VQSHTTRGLKMEFDNSLLPWHTVCLVRGPDQPGALQAITAAFAASRVVVHSARVSSSHGQITDRFSVSDRLGRKLDQAAMDRARASLDSAQPRRRRLFGVAR